MSAYFFLLAVILIAAVLSLIMAGAWLVWRSTRNSGWIDAIWTFGLGATGLCGALAASAFSGSLTARQVLVAALITFWSLRLGLHIARRTLHITDDPRYGKLVSQWGADALRQMFWLLQKQALVSIPLALSVILAACNPSPSFRFQDFCAVLVIVIAVIGEGFADVQLRSFRSDRANRDRVCAVGLWAWSRHPNYFFEWFGWLGYVLFAVDFGGAYPWGWAAILGPACMYWLLVHVSGIPPLEEHMLERRNDEFRAYQARTSAFFPVPPRIFGAGRP